MARNLFKFGVDPWDPTHRFETSWILSPFALFCCRALLSLYAFATLLTILIYDCIHSPEHCAESRATFSYFTHLTYWGLAFYFLVSAVHTFTYARSGIPLLAKLPRPLQALHSLFYTTVTVFPFIVTIVYWAQLYDGHWYTEVFRGWSNVSQHALNSAMALFEIIVPRTEPPLAIHMLWLIIILALYLCVAYVTYADKGFYTYNFLDPEEQGAMLAAWIVGIAVGCCILFGVVWGLIWMRKKVTEEKLGLKGKFFGGATAMEDASSSVVRELEEGKHEGSVPLENR